MFVKRVARAAVAALIVVGLSVALPLSASAARHSHARHRNLEATKPTIVLVHGAWADSGSWDQVIRRLQRDGYTVWAPPNPLMGLATDSATIADFLEKISGPIVLVGHSYGGEVITNAAYGNSQVKALVYVDAYIPAQGDSLESLTGAGSCFAVPPSDLPNLFKFVPFPGAPSGVYDAYVQQSVFPGCFANGLPAREGMALAATQRPLATNALTDQSGPPAWATIPSWDVVGTADHVIPPADQLSMAHRAGARITEIDAPHLSMIADPSAVTNVIEQAATRTG
ncbi:MAG TPA: alpha/beta hydrolase [Solirubrobacteraceae bacterium]|nr:alpha/beta hydrolase [Solirubrobacteraceae bacterium]